MPSSIVNICNSALARIGARTINSLDDQCKEARLCGLFYRGVRDALLRRHPWNFARKRMALAALAVRPDIRECYVYPLPPDCIAVNHLEHLGEIDDSPYWIEGRRLLSRLESPILVYTARIEDAGLFCAGFENVLSARLAAELALPVTGQRTLMEAAWSAYQVEAAEAILQDARENLGGDGTAGDSWLEVRT